MTHALLPAGRFIAAICLLASLGGCAVSPEPMACVAGVSSPMRIYELYFGRAVRGRADVSDAEWNAFRDTVVTASLPDGYTAFDGAGAWMNRATHVTSTEATKVLIAALPDIPASMAAIQRVRTAYETTFNQQSVGMTYHPGCGSFDQ
jgi:hypothetical protein